VTVGVAILCSIVGVGEWATQHLLLYNEKVLNANDLKPYFRVNSLFFDPNIYGRYLALTITMIAAVLLWATERRTVALCAGALAILWLGLVPTLSESSFAALTLGLAVLAALRWSPRPVLLTTGALGVAAIAAVLIAPGVIGLKDHSFKNIDKVTSGRADLVKGGLEMAADRPFFGYGAGGFSVEYRRRQDVSSPLAPAESHTIPITIAAEQGIVGLAAYVALLFVTLALVLHRAWESRARAAVAAAYAALVLHTLVYASFLEDPLTWALLAAAIVLRRPEVEGEPEALAADAVPA
jgi:O-antigen ligase